MAYVPNGVFQQAFRELYHTEGMAVVHGYREVGEELWRFSRDFWLPVMLYGGRRDRLDVYGRLTKAYALVVEFCTPRTAIFVTKGWGPLRAQAYLSGILFLTWPFIKRSQRQVQELVVFFDPRLHAWLIGELAGAIALPPQLRHLWDLCWTRELDDPMNGINYVLTHLQAEPRRFYPGFTVAHSERGAQVGEPHFPIRFGQHHVNTAN